MPEYKNDRRILFISDIGAAPPYRGNRIRMRALLKEIKNLGFEIHFAGIRFSETEKISTLPYIDKWITNFTFPKQNFLIRFIERVKKKYRQNNGPKSITSEKKIDRFFNKNWVQKAQRIQKRENYQIIFIPYIFNSKFFEIFEGATIKILDTHDIFNQRSEKLRKQGIKNTWFSTNHYEEKAGLERANRIIAIQKNDERYFSELINKDIPVYTVRHFVEKNFLEMTPSMFLNKTIGFLGSENPINIHGLRWFLSEVLPDLKTSFPDLRLNIGGSICSELDVSHDYTLLGEQKNPIDFFSKCLCTINPMRTGTGLKIKTIESLSYGRPVISTDTGAEGLEEFIDHGIMIANSKTEFITTISSLINSGRDLMNQMESCAMLIDQMNKESRNSLKMLLK